MVFFLFNVLPGNSALMQVGQHTDSTSVAAVKHDLGLDQPLDVQYLKYLNDLSPLSFYNIKKPEHPFFLDGKMVLKRVQLFKIGSDWCAIIKYPYLRRSYQNREAVSSIILKTIPNTFILALTAILFAAILGIFLGVLAAIYKDSWYDRISLVFSSLGMSLPSFFAAILIAWFFAFILGKYTGLEITGNLFEVDDFGNGVHLMLKNLILPSLTLGLRPLAIVLQLSRNSMLNVLAQDYIRTARAKGLNFRQVIWRHALKNSLNPVITSISGWFASMMAGVIFIEYIFGWKGLGFIIVSALNNYDLPLVMGAVLTLSVVFALINILVDFIYTALDPRIRLS